ncbi:hypothetical protein G6F68_018203 [Rhizopus microsporus]|nr:hypothetical protein G6F32_016237 [Rhizopus arrhizus]KAG1239881.1 hypothetical protein G6F68_018203 [Rhizopus microsporus]
MARLAQRLCPRHPGSPTGAAGAAGRARVPADPGAGARPAAAQRLAFTAAALAHGDVDAADLARPGWAGRRGTDPGWRHHPGRRLPAAGAGRAAAGIRAAPRGHPR